MIETNITRKTCDRCGHKVENENLEQEGWSEISFSDDPESLRRDLCPSCSSTFRQWFNACKIPTQPVYVEPTVEAKDAKLAQIH